MKLTEKDIGKKVRTEGMSEWWTLKAIDGNDAWFLESNGNHSTYSLIDSHVFSSNGWIIRESKKKPSERIKEKLSGKGMEYTSEGIIRYINATIQYLDEEWEKNHDK